MWVSWSDQCSHCLYYLCLFSLFSISWVFIKGAFCTTSPHTDHSFLSPVPLEYIFCTKKKKLVLICKFFCSQIHLYVSACVFWISIKILSSLWAWTISCSCLVLFSLSADYNVRHKIRTPLSIWWLVVKRIKEKGQPGVMYVLASGKYSSKKVLFLCSSAFYYRKQ